MSVFSFHLACIQRILCWFCECVWNWPASPHACMLAPVHWCVYDDAPPIYWYYEWVISEYERGEKRPKERNIFCYICRSSLRGAWKRENWFYFRTHTIPRLLTFNDEVSIIIGIAECLRRKLRCLELSFMMLWRVEREVGLVRN